MQPRYFFEYGSFYFRSSETHILFMCQQVSLIFDEDTGTVIKHGSKEHIHAYMIDPKFKALEESGMYKIRVITFDGSKEAATWINDTLASSGSILRRIKDLQAIAKPFEGFQSVRR